MEKYGAAGKSTDDNKIWRMRFACWITKGANTQSEYVIIIAFQRQQWCRERASLKNYTTLPAFFLHTMITSITLTENRHLYKTTSNEPFSLYTINTLDDF